MSTASDDDAAAVPAHGEDDLREVAEVVARAKAIELNEFIDPLLNACLDTLVERFDDATADVSLASDLLDEVLITH